MSKSDASKKIDALIETCESFINIIKSGVDECKDRLEKMDRDNAAIRDRLNKIQNNDAERDRLEKLEREAMMAREVVFDRCQRELATHDAPSWWM